VAALDSLAVTDYDASGRATTVMIIGRDGDVKKITGEQLRRVLSPGSIRSTCFTIKVLSTGEYQFTGRGWGHGQGMCQDGAVAMAKSSPDVTFQQILKHYYTGVDIQPLTASMLAGAP
jgi:stage II sporulation protein D